MNDVNRHSDAASVIAAPQRPRPTIHALTVWGLAVAAYLTAAIITTWPVARAPGDTVFGGPGDMTGMITLLRYRNDLGVGPLSNATTPLEGAPFGISLPGATSLPQVVIEGPAQLVAALTGNAVLAVNLVLISGLCLTALSCFALCLWITRNAWASGIAGLGYGFNPWIIERAHGHIHFTHLWALPLIVLGLMLIREHGGWRSWMLYATALAAACYTNTYISLFAAVTIGAFAVADITAAAIRRSARRIRAAIGRACFSLAIFIGVMIPQAIVATVQQDTIDGLLAGTRSPNDLYVYGSRWWEWITPSYRNPWYEQWTAPFLAARQHDSNFSETSLYLGAVTLTFALGGVALTLWRRRRGEPAWAGGLALCLLAIGLWVSLPKSIAVFGLNVPMPSTFFSHIVEPWRVYARLFAVVSLGAAMLAALGLTALLVRLPRRAVPLLALPLAVLSFYDLRITSTHFRADPPQIYRELGALADNAPRVEYPLVPSTDARHYGYIFYTQAAKRGLFNGGRAGTAGGSLAVRLQDPTSPWTSRTLSALGVRWAVMHPGALDGAHRHLAPGYRLIGDFAGSLLYEVTASPAPLAVPAQGFDVPEATGTRFDQWLLGSQGTIAIINPTKRSQDLTLEFTARAFVDPRTVRVLRAGREIARVRATVHPTRISLRAVNVPPGLSSLQIISSPGAYSIAKSLGSLDPRSVSIQVSGISVRAEGEEALRVG